MRKLESNLTFHDEVNKLIAESNFDEAKKLLERALSSEIKIEPPIHVFQFIEDYVRLAGFLSSSKDTENLTSACQILRRALNQLDHAEKELKQDIKKETECFILLTRGRGQLFLGEAISKLRYFNNPSLDYDNKRIQFFEDPKNESIYHIRKNYQKAIENLRNAKILNEDPQGKISIDIDLNLAHAFRRVGRYVEALTTYGQIVQCNEDNAVALINWSSLMIDLIDKNFIRLTKELLIKIKAHLLRGGTSIKNDKDNKAIQEMLRIVDGLEDTNNWIISKNEISNSKNDEKTSQLTQLRKFTLQHELGLNYYSLYSWSLDIGKDNLALGLSSEETHSQMITKLSIEYAFARLLFYQSTENNFHEEYSDIPAKAEHYQHGYSLEALKCSYRNCYSLLDKIGNEILRYYKISKKSPGASYFENVFNIYEENLKDESHFGLCALFSLSLELNKDKGPLRFFKTIRNELEHDSVLIITDNCITDLNNNTISILDLHDFTLTLLRIVRSALFSLVYLINEIEQPVK